MIGTFSALLGSAFVLQIHSSSFDWGGVQSFDPKIHSVSLPKVLDTEHEATMTVEVELDPSCESVTKAIARQHDEHPQVLQFHLHGQRKESACRGETMRLTKQVSFGGLARGRYEVRSLKQIGKMWGYLEVIPLRNVRASN